MSKLRHKKIEENRHSIRHRILRLDWRNLAVFACIVLVFTLSLYLFYLYNRGEDIPFSMQEDNSPLKPEAKPELKWWNSEWKQAIQITVGNKLNKQIEKGETVKLSFKHKELVDEDKSKSSASDIRIVYQDNSNVFTNLDFNLYNPNSDNTTVYFNLQEPISAKTETYRYFLYFNNPDSLSNDQLKPGSEPLYNRQVKADLQELIPTPFTYKFNRKWMIKGGKEIPNDYKLLIGSVDLTPIFNLPDKTFSWELVGTKTKVDPQYYSSNTVNIDVDTSTLLPGNYEIKMTFGDFKDSYKFKVTYPLYATWTMDWEGLDVKNEYLGYLNDISNTNGMPITHFFNPRIFVSNTITKTRAKFLLDWVKERQAKYGDEISMHLHMHSDFIVAAGVEPRTDTSWSNQGDGYDVITPSYTSEEFEKIVSFALAKFKENGLAIPKGYRAGGWYINLDDLKVLNKLGFVYDSSGREAYSFGKNRVPGFWSLSPTTKPYKVSVNNQNSSTQPTLNLWEFPNNGSESTNVPGTEMTKRLEMNFKGDVLYDKQTVTFLSHPHWFSTDKPKMEALFTELDKNLAKNDGGPIIFTTLEDAAAIWSNK